MNATMTVNSLAALGAAWNSKHDKKHQARPAVERVEKARKCRICGAEMEHIAGSNVYVCHGTIEVPKPTDENPDAKELKPCTNFALSKR